MIVKAINQDEFRDFSFVNPDWKIKEYRDISEIGDSAASSANNNTQTNLASNSTNFSSNNLLSTGSSPTSRVIQSASKCDSPSPLVRSTSPLISTNTISTNTSFSNITSNPSSSSISSLNPTRTIQNTDI